MHRFRPSSRFIKQVTQQADRGLRGRIFPALKRLNENPESKGINFEPVQGRPGFFTARVTYRVRLLLHERRDEKGPYFEIVCYGDHDDTY